MKKAMKKILALMLVAMMCVSMVVPAFAAETATCPGFDEDHFKTNCTATKIDTYEPKCGERGYTVYQCNTCSKYFADDFTHNTEEHDYAPTKAATCTEAGEKECSKCGDKKEIGALGHEWTPDANTCKAPGTLIHQECTRCDAERDVEATGIHTWTIEVVKKPTCGQDGVAKYTCTVCDYTKNAAIDYHTAEAGDHKWVFVEAVDMVCKPGEEVVGNSAGYVCSVCNTAAEIGATITVVAEDGTEKTVTIDATNHYEKKPVAHDHADDGEATIIPETCTTPAYEVLVCTVCLYTEMKVIEGRPALGHSWVWDNATAETTECEMVDGVFVPGKTVVHGTCKAPAVEPIAEGAAVRTYYCGASGTQTRNHKIDANDSTSIDVEVIEKDATCQVGAYTIYNCPVCGTFETEKGDPDADAHNYRLIYVGASDLQAGDVTDGTKAPTCTVSGLGYKACMNAGCDVGMELVEIPATGHSYMKNGAYDTTKAVYNCATGKLEYTCTNATCPVEKTNGITETVDIANFNAQDLTFHKDWDATAKVWAGADPEVVVDNGCGKNAIYKYHCSCGTDILVIVGTSHTVDKTNSGKYKAFKAATCLADGNYETFVCTKCDTYCYYDAEGALVEVGTEAELVKMIEKWLEEVNEGKAENELKTAKDYVMPWTIPATGCNVVIDKVFVAPVCGQAGQSAGWHCANANCDADPTYDEEYFETIVVNGVTYVNIKEITDEAAAELTGTQASVELTIAHSFKAATADQPGAPKSVKRTCSVYGYDRWDCEYCDTWMWKNYKSETGHNVQTTDALCTVNGYDVCENTWCEYRKDGALVLDAAKNPTYKEIKSTGHKDAEGNPIICVAEDFWCSECNPEPEENGKEFYPENYGKLKWYESHNTAGEDWKAVKEAYYPAYAMKGGMIPTDLSATDDCTIWKYLLYVCPDCANEHGDTKGGYFNDEVAPCTEHVYIDTTVTPNVVYSASKDNLKDIPAAAYTKIVKTATFAAAGTKAVECSCAGCVQNVATKEYVREDIGFDISIDSGIVAGADLVNSGKMKVTVLVNAWQVSLYSLDFEVAYNTNQFTYTGFELPAGSPFAKSGIYAAAKDGEVEVYMANAGETLTNIDLALKGTQKAVIVLVFDIKDDVNATTLGTTSGELLLNDAHVLTAAGTAVTVAADPNAEAGKADDVTKASDFNAGYVIKALGNVTGGVIENTETRIDDLDALNWQALFINKKYLAAADINKNGQLDAQDYEYLCTYIVDGMTYATLCAK